MKQLYSINQAKTGANIRRYRRLRGLTMENVAEALGVSTRWNVLSEP